MGGREQKARVLFLSTAVAVLPAIPPHNLRAPNAVLGHGRSFPLSHDQTRRRFLGPRPLSMVLTWSQRARESLGRCVSLADSKGCTRRSDTRPFTDESGTTVIVEEISFASVLETTIHGRVLGTSAPRAGSRLTQTKEPFTTKAIPLYPYERILD
jgi:hypothetical protein